MTDADRDDRLLTVWQSGPRPDTATLLQDLARQTQSQQRQRGLIFALLGCVSVLVIFAEASGGLRTHGFLSLVWLTGLTLGALRWHKDRQTRSEILCLDTQRLLQVMIRRAKRGLTLARCLYAGTPVGALAGYAITQVTHISVAGTHKQLGLFQSVIGAMLLVVMIGVGLMTARARRAELTILTQKKQAFEKDL